MGVDSVSAAAVFLDRDGVINAAPVRDGRPLSPMSVAEVEIPAGVPDALARLKGAGYQLVVVTNQPDVAAGRQRRDVVEAINRSLAARLPLDEFRVCYHQDSDSCECRKPKPGLLLQDPVHDLARSVMIGDRWRDVEAGWRARVAATILIDHGYDERCTVEPSVRVSSLSEAADWVIRSAKAFALHRSAAESS
jgi:D-glycero-D-manno-heptose 1,7-bisphosphate phosphatase